MTWHQYSSLDESVLIFSKAIFGETQVCAIAATFIWTDIVLCHFFLFPKPKIDFKDKTWANEEH